MPAGAVAGVVVGPGPDPGPGPGPGQGIAQTAATCKQLSARTEYSAVGGGGPPGAPTAEAEDIAPLYWDLHTQRDRAERVFTVLRLPALPVES
ncbi:hypothetical protein ABZS83_19690 [Streptomyces sp. NPDC005426]|uniref:hypothetical protein n=1 Tax=Streptomyces sp. NPDC005426 TaxID=3155344 RepID=UPI0033A1C267